MAAPPPPPADYSAPPPAYPPQTKTQPPGQPQYGVPPGQPQYGVPPGQPQYGVPPGQPGPSVTTVVVNQPGTVLYGGQLREHPANTKCPYCNAQVTTATSRHCGGFVWMIAGIICLIGLFASGITWLGCCLIPFCIPSLYDVQHTCPNCGRLISTWDHFN